MTNQRNNINYYTFTQKMPRKFARFKKTSYLCTRLQANVRDLAQLVAHTSGGREVAGSSPVIPTESRETACIKAVSLRLVGITGTIMPARISGQWIFMASSS